ncbi:TonB-dependent receptor [Vibrio sp.]|nr:TonB-dependent receptor [Vibrio sp.]
MKRFPLSLTAVAVLASTLSTTAWAQETEEQIVVVGNRTPTAISDVAGTVWYVDSDAIAAQARTGKTLDQILAVTVPSLEVSSGGRTHAGQTLRGRSLMVLIDGVSLQSVRSISRQLDSIDPFNIERIEVLSGASSLYGAGASGGIINIVTKKGEVGGTQFESFVGGTSGFNDGDDADTKIAQSISGGTEKAQGRFSVAYTQTQGSFDADGDIVNHDTTQGSYQFNDTLDVQGSTQIKLGNDQSLTILAQYYDSQQDSPYGAYFEKDAEGNFQFVDTREGYSSPREQGTERYLLSTTYHNANVLNHTVLAELSYRSEAQSYSPYAADGSSTLSLNSSSQDTDIINAKLALQKNLNKLTLTYGVDAFLDKFTSDRLYYDQATTENSGGLVNVADRYEGRYPGVDTQSLAGFVQAEYQLTESLALQGGYRYQYMNTEISDFQRNADSDLVPGGETDYDEGLFNLGAIFDLTNASQVWVSYAQGFDLANPAKYYGKDANSSVEDTTLEGIKTDSYEVGYRTELDRLSLQTALYYSESDGVIEYTDEFTVSGVSQARRVYGVEALASYWLTDRFQIGSTAHFASSEIEDDENGWQDETINEAVTSKIGTWLGWYDDSYNVKLQSLSMLDYEDADGNELNGYTTWDLIGQYELPLGSLGFGIQNIMNESYQTSWSQRATNWYAGSDELYNYQGRGRTFTVNYQVEY